MKIDLHESAYMSLLSLVQLIITPTSSVLSVIYLVERVTQHLSDLRARGIQCMQLSFDSL